MKAVFSNLIEIRAECEDCGWFAETANAQGLASQHAQRTGHLVAVDVTRHYEYATEHRYGMRPADARAAYGDRRLEVEDVGLPSVERG